MLPLQLLFIYTKVLERAVEKVNNKQKQSHRHREPIIKNAPTRTMTIMCLGSPCIELFTQRIFQFSFFFFFFTVYHYYYYYYYHQYY